jgi:hypothetical protein
LDAPTVIALYSRDEIAVNLFQLSIRFEIGRVEENHHQPRADGIVERVVDGGRQQ